MISSSKRQFAELLGEIGFIDCQMSARHMSYNLRPGTYLNYFLICIYIYKHIFICTNTYTQHMNIHTGEDGILQFTPHEVNIYRDRNQMIQALLAAALYPNVAKVFTPEIKYTESASGLWML